MAFHSGKRRGLYNWPRNGRGCNTGGKNGRKKLLRRKRKSSRLDGVLSRKDRWLVLQGNKVGGEERKKKVF